MFDIRDYNKFSFIKINTKLFTNDSFNCRFNI